MLEMLSNVRPKKRGPGLKLHPDFYRVDVDLAALPGYYFLSNRQKRTKGVSELLSIIRETYDVDRSARDIIEQISSTIVAKFPRLQECQVECSPEIKNSHIPNLELASIGILAGSHSRTKTRWLWYPDGSTKSSADMTLSMSATLDSNIDQFEHPFEGTSGHLRAERTRTKSQSLNQAHPLFAIHEGVAKSFFKQPEGISEARAIQLSQLAFKLADQTYPNNRVQNVAVSFSYGIEGDRGPVRVRNYVNTDRKKLKQLETAMTEPDVQRENHIAYIALGSNVGDRISMIESACKAMNEKGLKVRRTSALYETKPMYVEDQQLFVNGACEISTCLKPMELLDTLKSIEADLGREKSTVNGPRSIDLDILMYDKDIIENDRLSIPHKRMFEREFVLRPLCDLIPNSLPPLPDSIASFQEELDGLPRSDVPLSPLTPITDTLNPLSSQNLAKPTHLMAVLNLTPDSFSDGGLYSTAEPTSLIPILKTYLAFHKPISILDIGGQSTRPHAPQISPQEELSRILPTIHAIRSDPAFNQVSLSVDTYHSTVASAAIAAGANIINDVSAGTLDQLMLRTVADLGCTCVLMHMRGTPDTMTKLTDYPSGIITGVATELLARVAEAEKAGIRRWRIMLDPGIGFAKTQAQNIELLRRFNELREWEGLRGFPWVVGVSRKGFIGKITGVEEASERGWGTAAAVCAAVQGGADVVRVHDVKEMGECVRMADAIWRGR